MPVQHLKSNDSAESIVHILSEDGCVVVDDVLDATTRDALLEELQPWIDATPAGTDSFSGRNTRRTGGLIARSKTARDIVMHPLATSAADQLLADSTNYHLHLTQIIAIGPGSDAQAIHRDQWAFDFFPFPQGYEAQCNTIWALTDFTEENGATRVIPGSNHHPDRQQYTLDQTEPAEMKAGSVLFYTGSVYHGGGANQSDAVRMGINITYARAWLRQEENQYLTTPPEIARELPDDLLKMMGYTRGAYALGYVDDMRDPLDALRGRTGQHAFGDDDIDELKEKLGADSPSS